MFPSSRFTEPPRLDECDCRSNCIKHQGWLQPAEQFSFRPSVRRDCCIPLFFKRNSRMGGNGQILHWRARGYLVRPFVEVRRDAACDVDFLLVTFICLKNRRPFCTGALPGALHVTLIHPCPSLFSPSRPYSLAPSRPSPRWSPPFSCTLANANCPGDRCKFHKLVDRYVDVHVRTRRLVHGAGIRAQLRSLRAYRVVFHECLQRNLMARYDIREKYERDENHFQCFVRLVAAFFTRHILPMANLL